MVIREMSEFEKRVYRAVMEIPFGETRSYAWVARRIGRPLSARAVGGALGKNPHAPYVPCHRVIASDGSLGGYSAGGGLRKKMELLKKERELKEGSSCKSVKVSGCQSVKAAENPSL